MTKKGINHYMRKEHNSENRKEQIRLAKLFRRSSPKDDIQTEYSVFNQDHKKIAQLDIANITTKTAYLIHGYSHPQTELTLYDELQCESLELLGWKCRYIFRWNNEWLWE